ncbi:phosphatase PAP2 family protein [Ancylomarina euxinus]|uniref:Phosphatase PAP2 family protein n=1 Tax=Ancylomarina euxinus TaxID=2283627 RepID=A0A425Y7Q5_9BACT|nr:phosphatase PAP2 family protein [Ancylomarina euxinus]MCZ4693620.1 phosphatase PAP2 family protein [Ancylomarina euxinus]MUP13848.1 phosphatase PAP2 family protein [Ancylomarina euxinus]RRG24520.1 phosphatase PAP2 family protein [Ancylomarina euxinus]
MRIVFALLLCLSSYMSLAQNYRVKDFDLPFKNPYANRDSMVYEVGDNLKLTYYKPRLTDIFVNFARDMRDFSHVITRKETLPWMAGIAGTTALMVVSDRQTLNTNHDFMNSIGIDGEKKYGKSIKLGGAEVLQIPNNLNTFLYMIGEGLPSILIGGGFYIKGMTSKDYRALQTANQLMEEFLSMGVTCQLIKHATGRQSPWRASSGTGRWDLFPNQKDYMKNVSNYDAFPSGHMATMMCTVTILSSNYPEYKLIKPIGYGIMGAVGLAMMHNEVHWLSDYPLAIGIGYAMGKIISQRGRRVEYKNNKYSEFLNKISVYPSYFSSKSFGVKLVYHI